MLSKSMVALSLVAGLFLFGGTTAYGCGCPSRATQSTTANGSELPAAVGWAPSLEDALKSAAAQKKPIAIYFALKSESKVVGESPEAVRTYAAHYNNSVPSTVFELPRIIRRLRAMGVVEFVKIPATKEYSEWVSQYGCNANSIAIIAPGGERLDGCSVLGTGVDGMMASAKGKIEAWQARHAGEQK